MIPPELRPWFWDIKAEDFDPAAHPDYTILRILEYGDEKAVAWLRRNFPEEEIRRVIRAGRNLSRKSANYWALVYKVPLEEVAALTGSDQQSP
jgi:hypothetical protein